MAKYTLTTPEASIVTSWLFEQAGYLDGAVNDAGVTARQALIATPTLDVTAWIRANVISSNPEVYPSNWEECAMWWWVRKNSGVNITPGTRPPEAARWIEILLTAEQSIAAAFVRVSDVARNSNTVPLTDEAGAISSMPAGTHLIHQRSMMEKVRPVLA